MQTLIVLKKMWVASVDEPDSRNCQIRACMFYIRKSANNIYGDFAFTFYL